MPAFRDKGGAALSVQQHNNSYKPVVTFYRNGGTSLAFGRKQAEDMANAFGDNMLCAVEYETLEEAERVREDHRQGNGSANRRRS
jgi:hypothetical protein